MQAAIYIVAQIALVATPHWLSRSFAIKIYPSIPHEAAQLLRTIQYAVIVPLPLATGAARCALLAAHGSFEQKKASAHQWHFGAASQ